MACFPRLFHHRSKNKFTPAVDENSDTLLNTQDSPVQIGLYIRREEKPLYTPVITPSVSEARLQRPKQVASPSPTSSRHRELEATPENVASVNRGLPSANTNANTNDGSLQRQPKKFRSNKDKLQQLPGKQQQDNNGIGNGLPPGGDVHVNGHAINVTRSNSKLKPVKERRPTALPTEAPSVDIDGAVNVSFACCSAAVDGVGAGDGDGDGDDVDGGKSKLKVNVNGIIDESDGTPSTTTTTTTTTAAGTPTDTQMPTTNVKFFIGHTQELNAEQTDDALSWRASHGNDANNNNNNSSGSKLTNGTLPQAGHGHGLKQPSKSFSNVSLNYQTKCKRPSSASVAGQRQRAPTTSDIYIPPPPPMPTEPLLPDTALPLRKKKSAAAAAQLEPETEPEPEPEQKTESTSNASNSQDQIATPKQSDKGEQSSSSTKAHRVEGGLIYARPNLPVQKDIEIEFIAKDEATRNLIHNAIERNDFLNNLMDKERKEMVINAMAPASYEKDSYIIHEQEEGSEIYVSAEGYYDVLKAGQHVGNFGEGTVFGELAILYNAPRQATIKAATAAKVWKIKRDTFRAIMQISGSREREENLQFLRSAPFLQQLEEGLLSKVVDLLQRKFYETASCIVREGELGNEFYIIRGGTVTIKKKDEAQQEQVVARRKRGDYFGEQALMNADRRQASVYADAPGTEVLKLDREAFISYLGTIRQLQEKPDEGLDVQGRSSNKSAEFDNEYAHIAISELKKVATLGAGAFGRVDLVTHGSQVFALKIIKKIEVVKQDQIEHVYNEKNVMMKCRNSPFIAQLYRTYRNEKYVYFLMEACMGGDVWTVMSKRQYFDEKTAKFIAGCVVEAFDFLHSHNFIYRDLKPENLMLSTDGYCKLVDFGFAKYVRPNEKTNTFAGTPEYVAPEIILDRGHDRSVDYWGLGILIFELLVGKTPFRGLNQIKIYQNIMDGIDVIHMPSRIPKTAQHLIRHLCKQLPAERLGYQRRGIADIKRHGWFDSLDWARLKQKQLPSPIKRPLKHGLDVQYFGPSGVEGDYEPPEELSGWDKDF